MDTLDAQLRHRVWNFVGDEHFEKTICWQLHIHGDKEGHVDQWLYPFARGRMQTNIFYGGTFIWIINNYTSGLITQKLCVCTNLVVQIYI